MKKLLERQRRHRDGEITSDEFPLDTNAMNRGSVLVILILAILASSCVHTVQTNLPGLPKDQVLYRAGIEAFQRATPEGYQQAIDDFRKASGLAPSRCEYSLHLAESLVLFAREQRYNWEEFEPGLTKAIGIIDSVQRRTECGAYESFVDRLRALSEPPGRDALGMIKRAIELDPNDPMNWYALWRLDLSNSQQAILRATALAPDLALIQYELGNYRSLNGEYPEAAKAFERALELSPRHFRSMIGLAYAIDSMGFSPEVEGLYRKSIDIAPTFLEGHARLGDYYADLVETEQAIKEYQAAINLNANYDRAYLTLGITLFQAMRLDDAEQALLWVVKLSPASSEAHYFLGNIWFARGDLAKAKAQYQEALRYRLNYPDSDYALGLVFYEEGNVDEAITEYNKVLTINPQYPDAYLSRGMIRLERRQFEDAITDETHAIETYEQEISELEGEARKAESLGLTRKAEAEREQLKSINGMLQRARELKIKGETAVQR
jgi:tetratricopeptide (TPR) repeat protein